CVHGHSLVLHLVETEGKHGDVVQLRVPAAVGLETGDEALGLLGQWTLGMTAPQDDEAPAAEAEAMLAAGVVEEAVGAQVAGPARRQLDILIGVLALALVGQGAASALVFAHLVAVAGVQGDLRPGEAQAPGAAVDPYQAG